MNKIINNIEIRIVGLRRSGNHAIINWLASHYNRKICFLNDVKPITNPFLTFKKNTIIFNKDFYKEFNIDKEKCGKFSKKKCLMYSYEDESLKNIFHKNFKKNHDKFVGKSKKIYNIIILRDPFNMFASRFALNYHSRKKNFLKEFKIRELWKSYAREYLGETDYLGKNKITINYNLWFSNNNYRRSIENKLGLKPNDEKIREILNFGNGSSFDGMKFNGDANKMKVLERWKILANDEIYKFILKDKQLIKYSNKIFGKIPETENIIKKERLQNINHFYIKIKIRVLSLGIIEDIINYFNQKIGIFGIFLKKHHPRTYFLLKRIK